MGCDIHLCIERKVDGKWIMVNRAYHMGPACERSYERFALLANIRSDTDSGIPPKGVPSDVSESTQLAIDEWGEDGHSHSHMDAKLAAAVFMATDNAQGMREFDRTYPEYYYFGIEEGGNGGVRCGDHRIVFWFDN